MLKRKAVRLTGKALRELNEAVYERDQHRCVNCKRWVEDGHKFHHILFKSQGGGDTLDNAVLLCYDCHQKVHASGGYEITAKLKRYVEWMEYEIHNEQD